MMYLFPSKHGIWMEKKILSKFYKVLREKVNIPRLYIG